MSPTQAAKAAGVDRRTIMRALQRGWLKGWRDNLNQWKIDPASLRDCEAAHWTAHGQADRGAQGSAQPLAYPAPPPETLELAILRERLEGVERARDVAEEARAAAERDRDAWREEAGAARAAEARERERAERERARADGAEKGREAAERERDALRERRPQGLLRRLLRV